MRLWSIPPSYLDARGLVALWREGLLAQKVLRGRTNGYRNHPQLTRFRRTPDPVGAIAAYLGYVVGEADGRGCDFNRRKIVQKRLATAMTVTGKQVEYEFGHLLAKLRIRDPGRYHPLKALTDVKVHPLFRRVSGEIEEWEIRRGD